MENLDKRCPHCGSDNIGLTTTVSWNVGAQCWEPGEIEEIDAFCRDCDAEDFDPETVDPSTANAESSTQDQAET